MVNLSQSFKFYPQKPSNLSSFLWTKMFVGKTLRQVEQWEWKNKKKSWRARFAEKKNGQKMRFPLLFSSKHFLRNHKTVGGPPTPFLLQVTLTQCVCIFMPLKFCWVRRHFPELFAPSLKYLSFTLFEGHVCTQLLMCSSGSFFYITVTSVFDQQQ